MEPTTLVSMTCIECGGQCKFLERCDCGDSYRYCKLCKGVGSLSGAVAEAARACSSKRSIVGVIHLLLVTIAIVGTIALFLWSLGASYPTGGVVVFVIYIPALWGTLILLGIRATKWANVPIKPYLC